ncbi:MAG: hypothetical protein IJH92_07475 [Mogibacterium sp.]|nr:hypothetical protein [Mogibacterium sp.]
MKEDRLITTVGVLAVVLALMSMSVGKYIMGGIIMLVAFGIFWNRGGGKFNDRSIYEKIVKSDLTIDELYEKLKDVDTPFGKAWKAEHKGFSGESIVFGPGRFKDCVIISRDRGKIDIKHITKIDNIVRSSDQEYRFSDLIDSAGTEVTPERYSVFAGFKLASVMLVKHLFELITELSTNKDAPIPDSLDFFKFYYHNSSEGFFRDSEGNDVLKVDTAVAPFTARVLDTEGAEMASVVPRAFNARGEVADSAGFDILADGESYGEITILKDGKKEGFIVNTPDGEFRVVLFPACLRANISCNYTIENNSGLMAVTGGSPNLLFDSEGRCQNDVILSYDDDYLVLYAMIEVFIMTLNRRFLK